MTAADIAIVVAGALAGGFVNGLAGFGTGISALPVWLLAVPPVAAAQMVAAMSVVGQVRMLPAVWPTMERERIWPFVVPGLAGVPIGVVLTPMIPVAQFRLGVGLVLVVYASALLASERWPRLRRRGRLADALVGFSSGILGGLAGLSGVLLTLWTLLQGLARTEKRALFQAYNLSILLAVLVVAALLGRIADGLHWYLLLALPATLVGNAVGVMAYGRISDRSFDRILLRLLLAAGLVTIALNAGLPALISRQ